MKDGVISEIGTYAELIENDGAFAEFVHTFASVEECEEEQKIGMVLLTSCCSMFLVDLFTC